MGEFTSLAYISRRVGQIALEQGKIMGGLGKFSRSVRADLLAQRAININLSGIHNVPIGVAQELSSRGTNNVNLELVGGSESRDLESKAIRTALRHLALRGVEAQPTDLDLSCERFVVSFPNTPLSTIYFQDNVAVNIIPGQDTGQVTIRISTSTEIKPLLAQPIIKPINLGSGQKVIAGIIKDMPAENMFSVTHWREKLADVVMQSPEFVSKFKELTNKFIEIDKKDVSFHMKAHMLRIEANQLFSKAEKAKLSKFLRLGFWVMNITPMVFYLSFAFSVKQAARLFIAGENTGQALNAIKYFHNKNVGYVMDFVAEEAKTPEIAEHNINNYLNAMDQLPSSPERVMSVKLSGLVENFDATKLNQALWRLSRLLEKALKTNTVIVIDMERFHDKDITFKVLMETIRRSNYRFASNLGVVIQTYLKSSLEDMQLLTDFAAECSRATQGSSKLFVRVVKGAYPVLDKEHVLGSHEEVNQRFIECLRLAFKQFNAFRLAIGSHNMRTVSDSIALAQAMGYSEKQIEFEVLMNMPTWPTLIALANQGYRARYYMPVGQFVDSIGYFMRRMEENASSSSCQRLFKQFRNGELTEDQYIKAAFKPAN